MEQQGRDKRAIKNSATSARAELYHRMGTETPQTMEKVQGIMKRMAETNTYAEYYSLSKWGIPTCVVEKYIGAGVTTLFPWQVECLLADGGAPLVGGNLVYSAPTSGRFGAGGSE